ncbi:MAG TPA: ABC transporter permease subunit [Nocardioides sp.]|nr:ABC transporter permease subunit [Nocardioides sp.]
MSPRLVRVELTRLRWRRAVLALVLLAVVIPALIGAARAWSTRPVSDDELAGVAREQAAEIERCVDKPRRYFGLPKDEVSEERCTDLIVGWYTGREELSLAQERQGGSGMAVVSVLTALLLLAGTTFVGHDWNSGSMSNQLLFEPRRRRVWTAKALAVTLVALLTATIVSSAYWLAMWATMRSRDLPMRDGALTDSLAFGMRGAAFAAAAALGGFALTMLLRSTVATIGVLFAVSVAGGVIVAVLGLSEHWQPHKNVAAVVKNGTTYYVEPPESCFVRQPRQEPEPGSECSSERVLSVWDGAGYYGAALVLTAGASLVSFRRRDVP